MEQSVDIGGALLQLGLLDSDAATGEDASACGRAIVRAFAVDRLEAERATGASAAVSEVPRSGVDPAAVAPVQLRLRPASRTR
jgi:hypothetical protein